MSTQNNAPDAWRGVEGDDQNTNSQGGEPIMHIISDSSSKYHGWTVRVGADYDEKPIITDDIFGRGLMRIHCLATRTPSKREFVIRPFTSATPEERAEDLHLVRCVHRQFENAEAAGFVGRIMNKEGRYWVYVIWPGSPIEDPLVQLELEMMIDLTSGVRA